MTLPQENITVDANEILNNNVNVNDEELKTQQEAIQMIQEQLSLIEDYGLQMKLAFWKHWSSYLNTLSALQLNMPMVDLFNLSSTDSIDFKLLLWDDNAIQKWLEKLSQFRNNPFEHSNSKTSYSIQSQHQPQYDPRSFLETRNSKRQKSDIVDSNESNASKNISNISSLQKYESSSNTSTSTSPRITQTPLDHQLLPLVEINNKNEILLNQDGSNDALNQKEDLSVHLNRNIGNNDNHDVTLSENHLQQTKRQKKIPLETEPQISFTKPIASSTRSKKMPVKKENSNINRISSIAPSTTSGMASASLSSSNLLIPLDKKTVRRTTAVSKPSTDTSGYESCSNSTTIRFSLHPQLPPLSRTSKTASIDDKNTTATFEVTLPMSISARMSSSYITNSDNILNSTSQSLSLQDLSSKDQPKRSSEISTNVIEINDDVQEFISQLNLIKENNQARATLKQIYLAIGKAIND